MEGSLTCVQSDVVRLESLSSVVSQECTERRQELTAALENWTRYNEALEGFKEVLAKGEVELTRRKSSNVTGIEAVSDQILEIQVGPPLIANNEQLLLFNYNWANERNANDKETA